MRVKLYQIAEWWKKNIQKHISNWPYRKTIDDNNNINNYISLDFFWVDELLEFSTSLNDYTERYCSVNVWM